MEKAAKATIAQKLQARKEERATAKANKKAAKQVSIQNRFSKKHVRKFIVSIFLYLVLFDLAFVFLYPFITMIIDSLKTDADLVNITVKWIPSKLEWSNYKAAFEGLDYFGVSNVFPFVTGFLKNSLFVTAVATVAHTFVCAFVGYGFARFKFPGKGAMFAMVILTMLVPTQVLIFPMYITYSGWGWLNTYLPLLVPCFLGYGLRGGFYIFLFRQFFLGAPYEMEEAARIDGCNALGTFFRIMLPMSRSSILVCTVLSIVWHWNDYFEPSIYLTQAPELALLPSRLPRMYEALAMMTSEVEGVAMSSDMIINKAVCMASTFLVILPLLIAYMFVQKQFMEGVERSGLTGM